MESPIEQPTNTQTSLKPKQKFEGKVMKTSLQGAILDIGEKLPGFLHISQVIIVDKPDAIVRNLEEVIKVGDTINVWVRRVLKDHVELTMREPLGLEWREIQPENVYHGKIVRLEQFGVFVEIGAERPGLVHVSEISHNYVRVPSEVVKIGDEVDVKVLEVDKRKKQIKLSMKALQEAPEPEEVEQKRPAKKGKAKQEVEVEAPAEEIIPDPTFMEIALRQAMDRAEKRKPQISNRVKRAKDLDSEHDEIFDRTLKGKQNQD
ncbi:MAG TPA: S1 RNA-binding domain-containing protein [Anaerolineaceae bacterium]|jgi:ribosomal protein S1|nr:30S ribosomal protein S1 [Anaerolineaceae bacterium]NMD27231.1 30S ribosomal protein S1 [Chloroflexota bacterium]HOA21939.1 S1 RNA-binding domain-containing protein [Anaerolineaceae bacterium]HOG78000.1 S1 RNA-binding domain-containing protein [Anaerolineaceae bacterium]